MLGMIQGHLQIGIDDRNLYTWAFEIKNEDLKTNA
jgi:hypothetical protein